MNNYSYRRFRKIPGCISQRNRIEQFKKDKNIDQEYPIVDGSEDIIVNEEQTDDLSAEAMLHDLMLKFEKRKIPQRRHLTIENKITAKDLSCDSCVHLPKTDVKDDICIEDIFHQIADLIIFAVLVDHVDQRTCKIVTDTTLRAISLQHLSTGIYEVLHEIINKDALVLLCKMVIDNVHLLKTKEGIYKVHNEIVQFMCALFSNL